MRKIDRTDETRMMNCGEKATIIKYNTKLDIAIEFEDGYKVYNSTYNNFKNGRIKSPYAKTICGFGYIGEGKYSVCIDGTVSMAYDYWRKMLMRCYDEKVKEKRPTYKDVTCSKEWLNFQNFAQWFNENYYKVDNERMELDKDILIKGNRIYSADTCIFVTDRINSLLVTCPKRIDKDLPIGVVRVPPNYGYRSQCSINGKQIRSKTCNTVEEAFNFYKKDKESYMKQIADEYKNTIPKNLYDALYKYEVKITD